MEENKQNNGRNDGGNGRRNVRIKFSLSWFYLLLLALILLFQAGEVGIAYAVEEIDRAINPAEHIELTVPERLRIQSLQPGRADIVVHGICILLACMEELKIERLTVSEFGNLDGFLRRKYALAHLSSL